LIQFYDGASWQDSGQFTVADGAITTVKLADNSVTSDKIAPGTVIAADIAAGSITNTEINASAAIADTKLATISTAGKVSNSATTATSSNTNSAIIARDSSGNFTATTANLTSASVSGTVSASAVTVVSASVSGRFDGTAIREVVTDTSVSGGVVTADYSTGDIFYVGTAPSGNFTVNLTNAPTDNGKTITIVIFVTQGATGYYPSVVQVAGAGQTIKWANSAAPVPTSSAGKIDIFSFTFVRRSSAWTVFGSSNLGY
jgi:hypothetical protein